MSVDLTQRLSLDVAPSAADTAMERYANGDDAAFGELYDLLAPRLYGFLLRRTRRTCVAEDLVQQTMLQIHRARGRFHPGAAVLPWAIAIARRLLLDGVRAEGRRPSIAPTEEVPDVAAGTGGPDEELAARRLAERLDERLRALPEAQRVAFELLQQDGLTLAEAAEVLGTTVTAVKLRAHRAYCALRDETD